MKSRALAWLSSLFKPLPLTIGAIGYGSVLGVKTLPLFAPYAASWYWLLIFTGVCQSLLALHESYRNRDAPIEDAFFNELIDLRGKIAVRLGRVPTQVMKAEIPQLVTQLDQEILPRVKALALRHRELGAELATYQNPQYGRIKPSPPVLRELQQLYEKQEEVMKGIVQEVADIDATLSGFIQEGDEKQLVASMQAWKESLGSRWESLKELLEQ
jgi:hypothetical protein